MQRRRIEPRKRGMSIDEKIDDFSDEYFTNVASTLFIFVMIAWMAIAWVTSMPTSASV
jgi:hypothetical protein